MFLKDVTNVPTRSQTILSKLGIINQELIVKHVHVVNQLEWGMHVWLSKRMKVEAFGNYLQFSIFHFCSIIESPGRVWLYSPIVCRDTMCVNPTENVTRTSGKMSQTSTPDTHFWAVQRARFELKKNSNHTLVCQAEGWSDKSQMWSNPRGRGSAI